MFGMHGYLGWFILGLVLIAAEALIAPGSYLLWIGLAAFAVGALAAFFTVGLVWQLVLFGALGLACGLIGWKVYRHKAGKDAAHGLHDPLTQLAGREFALDAAIDGGIGRIKVLDTVWRVRGPDLPAGARVRVTGSEGGTLVVEKV